MSPPPIQSSVLRLVEAVCEKRKRNRASPSRKSATWHFLLFNPLLGLLRQFAPREEKLANHHAHAVPHGFFLSIQVVRDGKPVAVSVAILSPPSAPKRELASPSLRRNRKQRFERFTLFQRHPNAILQKGVTAAAYIHGRKRGIREHPFHQLLRRVFAGNIDSLVLRDERMRRQAIRKFPQKRGLNDKRRTTLRKLQEKSERRP